MLKYVAKALDKIAENLEIQQKKLEHLRENMSCIEYWSDCGDGGSWKPFTEEIAEYDHKWHLNELRVNVHYLVKTDSGIRILNKEEYTTFMGDTLILYQGTYQACKDFLKI